MVKFTAEQIPDSQMRLDIEVEPERIAKSVDKAYRKIVGRINVPGFRRGKAPRAVVERMVGREALLQEGLEDLLGEVYREAVEELDIHPIDQPEIDLTPSASELKLGDTLHVKVTVPVRPDVELGDYHAIQIPTEEPKVSDEEVNQIVERLQEQHTEWAPVEREARIGDRVQVDVTAKTGLVTRMLTTTGEPLVQSAEGEKTILDEKGVELELATEMPGLAAGFADQIVGMTVGQEKKFELTLPEDYSDPDLANKAVTYEVKVEQVKEKHAPALDDEFAKTLGYDTFAAMREAVQRQAQNQAEARARDAYEETVIQRVVGESKVEIPPALVNHEIDHLVDQMRDNLQRQRLDLDEYLRVTRKSEEELRESFRERALNNVKTTLILQDIGQRENVEVTPDEIEREVELMALLAGNQADKVRQALATPEQRSRIADRIRYRKTIDLLVDTAKPTETTPEAASAEEKPAVEGAPTEPEAPAGASATEPASTESGEARGELDKE